MGDPLSIISSTFTILEATVKVSKYVLNAIGEYRRFDENLSKIYWNVLWTSDILIELKTFIQPERRSLAEGGPPRRKRSWYNKLQTVLQSCEGILRRLNEKIDQYRGEPSWNRNKFTWAIAGYRDIHALNEKLTLERAEIRELFDFARIFREKAVTRRSNTHIQFLRQNLHKAVALHNEMAENDISNLGDGQYNTAHFSTQPSAVETGGNENPTASNIEPSHRGADHNQTCMDQAVGLKKHPSGHDLSNNAAQKPHEPEGNDAKLHVESPRKEPVIATDTAADVRYELAEPSKPLNVPNGASTLVRTPGKMIDDEPTEVVEHHEHHSNTITRNTDPASRRAQVEQRLTSTGNANEEQSQAGAIHDEDELYTHDRDQPGSAHPKQQTPAEEQEVSVHDALENQDEGTVLHSDDELYTYDRDQPGTAHSKQQTPADKREDSVHDAPGNQGEAGLLHSDDELYTYDREQPTETHVREVTKNVAGLENNLIGRGELNSSARRPPPRRATVESQPPSPDLSQRTLSEGQDERPKSREVPRARKDLHRPREDNPQGLRNPYLPEKYLPERYLPEKLLEPVGLGRRSGEQRIPSRVNWVPVTHPTVNSSPASVPNVTTVRRSMYVDQKHVSDLRDPPRTKVGHEGPVRLYEGWTLYRTPQSLPPNAEFPTATWLRCTRLEIPWSYETLKDTISGYVGIGRRVPQDYLELSVHQRHQIERLLVERGGLGDSEAFEVIIEAMETFPEGATKFQVKSIQLVLHRRPRIGAITDRVTGNRHKPAHAVPLQTPVEPIPSTPPPKGMLDPAAPGDLLTSLPGQLASPAPNRSPSPSMVTNAFLYPVTGYQVNQEASNSDAASFASLNGMSSSSSSSLASRLRFWSNVMRASSPARKGSKCLLDIFGKKSSKDQANTKTKRRGGRHGIIPKESDGSDQGAHECEEQSIPQTTVPQTSHKMYRRARHLDSQNEAAVRLSYERNHDLFPGFHPQRENWRRQSEYPATNTDIPYESMMQIVEPDGRAYMSTPVPFSGHHPTRLGPPAALNYMCALDTQGQPLPADASIPSMGHLTYPTSSPSTGERGMAENSLGVVQVSRSLAPDVTSRVHTEDALKDLYAKYGDPRNDPDTNSMNETGPGADRIVPLINGTGHRSAGDVE